MSARALAIEAIRREEEARADEIRREAGLPAPAPEPSAYQRCAAALERWLEQNNRKLRVAGLRRFADELRAMEGQP